MNRDAEAPRHGRRQRLVRSHVFARAPALDVVDNRVGALVGPLRSGTLGRQPGDPVRLERGRGPVERLAADPEARGDLGHWPPIDLMAAHHLVTDLHAVARVEERMAHKGVVADGLGVWMQGSCLAQGLRLGVGRQLGRTSHRVCHMDYDKAFGWRQGESDLKPKDGIAPIADFCHTPAPMTSYCSLLVYEIRVTSWTESP